MTGAKSPQIAVLASGSGTTVEAVVRASHAGKIRAQVRLVICNNPGAGVFKRIETLNNELGTNIKTVLINSKTHPATDEQTLAGSQTTKEQEAILEYLQSGEFDLIVLMGYMKRVGNVLVQAYGWRDDYQSPFQASMLNTHPGLLPQTKSSFGKPAQQLTIDLGLHEAGQTLHVVAAEYDDGPVIAEHRVTVSDGETADTLFEKVQLVEKQYLPTDLETFIINKQMYLAKQGDK